MKSSPRAELTCTSLVFSVPLAAELSKIFCNPFWNFSLCGSPKNLGRTDKICIFRSLLNSGRGPLPLRSPCEPLSTNRIPSEAFHTGKSLILYFLCFFGTRVEKTVAASFSAVSARTVPPVRPLSPLFQCPFFCRCMIKPRLTRPDVSTLDIG